MRHWGKANMKVLVTLSKILNQVFVCLAGVFLAAMILLSCSNIFLRIVWVPVKGTYELMGFFGAVVTAFALGYTQSKRGHIGIDIVVMRFSAKAQRILHGINYLICMVFFSIAGRQIAKWAGILRQTGEVTETLRIVFYPFTYGVALGCFALALVLLVDFLRVLVKGEGAL
jgi:TRAP-type C4-dicarboxylate transport system permease small subunit